MHKSYSDILRSMLESDKKLKQMVQEAKDDQLISEFEEEAEDEQIEQVDDE